MAVSERVRVAALGWLATVTTSLSFYPALAEKDFLLLGAFYAAVVVGTGVLLRSLRLPAFVVLLIQLLVLAEALLLHFGEDLRFGIVPTEATFAGIEEILRAGSDVAQQYSPPAPASPGLTLMVVFAVALTAIVVDAIAVGLGRVPLAGLPLLTLYTVPVAVLPSGVPVLAFVAGAAAYVAMVMADERDRLAHWGRLVSRQTSPHDAARIDTSGLGATGRRVSVIAVAAAVVLPVFVPTLPAALLDGGGSGEGDGDGQRLSFRDPMVTLAEDLKRDEPVELIHVAGETRPQYLRMVVLDTPTPDAWVATKVDTSEALSIQKVLPDPTGLTGEVEVQRYDFDLELTDEFPDDSRWLPVPFNAYFVKASDDFAYVASDQTVVATTEDAVADIDDYVVSFDEIMPTPEQLRSAGPPPADIVERYGDVPNDVPAVVIDKARELTAGADNPYDQATALQSFFRGRGEFEYNLQAKYDYGYQSMAQFLEKREGFCQHFSATMAMMARSVGIPTRIAVGFLEPPYSNSDGEWVFTSHNVHAWPELYFDGVGWVRFEPTPGIGAEYPEYAPRSAAPQPTDTPSSSVGPNNTAEQTQARPTEAPTTAAAGGGGDDGSSGPLPSRGWLVLAALVLLAVTPAGLRSAVRRSRLNRPMDSADAAEAAWLELRDRIRDLRLPWTGSMTPRARERAVAELLYGDQDGLRALHRLTLSVERARYARSLAPDADPRSDVAEVLDVVGREAERSQRLRAFFLPSSLLPDIRTGWEVLQTRLRPGRAG